MSRDDIIKILYIGQSSKKHAEPFIKCNNGFEAEIWFLAPYCLGKTREEAVVNIMSDYELTLHEAEAAWLFCIDNPELAQTLTKRHSEWTNQKPFRKKMAFS